MINELDIAVSSMFDLSQLVRNMPKRKDKMMAVKLIRKYKPGMQVWWVAGYRLGFQENGGVSKCWWVGRGV